MALQVYGYEEDFVDAPPEYLKCIICLHVLREPVQLLQCGHHYCRGCFESTKAYSSHCGSELRCPIDREVIDLSKISKNRFLERLVADLHVKCRFKNNGCIWVGELRDIEVHASRCTHAVQEDPPKYSECCGGDDPPKYSQCHGGDVGIPSTDVLKRLERCEEGLREKEKYIAHMNRRDEMVENLRKEVAQLKRNGFEFETTNICISNKEEIEKFKKRLKQKDNEINNLKIEITDLKRKMDELGNKALIAESCEGGVNVGSGGKEAAVGAVGGCADERTFVWNCKINKLRVNVLTYSPHFYCCNYGNNISKLSVYLSPNKQIQLYFDVKDGPIKSKSTYNVNVELLKLDESNMKEKICSKEVDMNMDGWFLCNMDENKYKKFINNNFLNISISWKCHH